MDVPGLVLTGFTALVSSSVVGGLIVFVLHKAISRVFDKDLERFKGDLQREKAAHEAHLKAVNEQELESFKDRLRQAALEHEVRFTRLHEKQAEVTEALYKKLAQAERCFVSLINPMQLAGEPDRQSKLKSAQDAGNEFVTFFDENRIYFDESLCRGIEQFNNESYSAFVEFFVFVAREDRGIDPKMQQERWTAAWDKVKGDLPPIRLEIEKSFRSMLGVSTADA